MPGEPAGEVGRGKSLRSCLRRPAQRGSEVAVNEDRGVTFHTQVDIREYSRQLGGGGGVPTDGSWVALGLGQARRAVEEPLNFADAAMRAAARLKEVQANDDGAPERPDEDAASYISSSSRAKILKAAMGEQAYKREWNWHRREMAKVHVCRRISNADPADRDLMPSSMEEARARAEAVSKELAGLPLPPISNDMPTGTSSSSRAGRPVRSPRPKTRAAATAAEAAAEAAEAAAAAAAEAASAAGGSHPGKVPQRQESAGNARKVKRAAPARFSEPPRTRGVPTGRILRWGTRRAPAAAEPLQDWSPPREASFEEAASTGSGGEREEAQASAEGTSPLTSSSDEEEAAPPQPEPEVPWSLRLRQRCSVPLRLAEADWPGSRLGRRATPRRMAEPAAPAVQVQWLANSSRSSSSSTKRKLVPTTQPPAMATREFSPEVPPRAAKRTRAAAAAARSDVLPQAQRQDHSSPSPARRGPPETRQVSRKRRAVEAMLTSDLEGDGRSRGAARITDRMVPGMLSPLQELGATLNNQEELRGRSESEWGSIDWTYSGFEGVHFRFDCRTRRFLTRARGMRKTICVTPKRGWVMALHQAIDWCLDTEDT